MRRKLYFGVALALAMTLVAGGFLLSHSVIAQDAKKAEPEQKKKGDEDLFEILKKTLEAKSDKPVAPPSKPMEPGPLPLPQPALVQPERALPLPQPVAGDTKPLPLPQPAVGDLKPLPMPAAGDLKPLPTPQPAGDLKPLPAPTPISEPMRPRSDPLPNKNVEPFPPLGNAGGAATKSDTPPAKSAQAIGSDLKPLPTPDLPVVTPAAGKHAEPVKLKGSAWSLYIEMDNGQTIVTATVNKKHEFKIVCQSVDLQTVAGSMNAKGKVQITGDSLNASCDQLILPLHDDRLVLQGAVEVRTQKTGTNVSDAKPAAFELKGDKLDLRISELQSSAFLETNWRKVSGDSEEIVRVVPASMRSSSEAKWSQYGTLRNAKTSEKNVWSLQKSNGEVIAYLVTSDGKSLEQYVGRTVAAYGIRDGERGGYPVYRVSHIAVP